MEADKKEESGPSQNGSLREGLEIIVLVGIAACGKSTYIKNNCPAHYRVNLDSVHAFLDPDKGFDTKNRNLARKIEDEIIRDRLMQNISVVIDNTNLDAGTRKKYIDIAREYGITAKAVYFKPDLEKSLRQNKERAEKGERYVPESAIKSHAEKIQKPSCNEGFNDIIEIE